MTDSVQPDPVPFYFKPAFEKVVSSADYTPEPPNSERSQYDRERHGCLFDRGSADAYYGRPVDPHWYAEKNMRIVNLPEEEQIEYIAGYEDAICLMNQGKLL